MQKLPLTDEYAKLSLAALKKNDLFGGLKAQYLSENVLQGASLWSYEKEEDLIKPGDAPDFFFVIVQGHTRVYIHGKDKDSIQVGTHGPSDTLGEVGLLLQRERTASVTAEKEVLALKFSAANFSLLLHQVPDLGFVLSQALAMRLNRLYHDLPVAQEKYVTETIEPAIIKLLPYDFIVRHRVVPLEIEGDKATLGFVDEPTIEILHFAQKMLTGMEINAVHITREVFNQVLRRYHASEEQAARAGAVESAPKEARQEPAETMEKEEVRAPSRLDTLIKRMISEGASDLHLSAKRKPYWRIDGIIQPIEDSPELGPREAFNLLKPVMNDRPIDLFINKKEVDFAYSSRFNVRFRVNMFQDLQGTSAVLRLIPHNIMTVEQLALPVVIKRFCQYPNGLVLVTGPAGSGKSTTLAALIEHINRTKRTHIVTLEDPIEFIHKNKYALINQREIGTHSETFASALRSALREDPDVILVGELRDYETIALALEASNTGHLVFATLHTSSAISTIERIIQVFPHEQQNKIQSLLADNLRGTISQTLCQRRRGGRIVAVEVLFVSHAVSYLIREGKLHQVTSNIQTTKGQGNMTLNQYLARLVHARKITAEEALSKAVDKPDLEKRLLSLRASSRNK